MKRLLMFFGLLGLCASPMNAQTSFTDISASAGVQHDFFAPYLMGGGGAFIDYDEDGNLDIYLTGGSNDDILYHNNGDGTFTDVTAAAGLSGTAGHETYGVIAGDIDNDGYRDLFITTYRHDHNLLYYNNGDGTFTDISVSAGMAADSLWGLSAAFGDYNLDGYLDVYVGNYVDTFEMVFDTATMSTSPVFYCFPNKLFMNNGDNTFSEISASVNAQDSGCTLATVFTDYDDDGDLDIFDANDFGVFNVPNVLLQNNYPLDSYTDVSVPTNMDVGMFGMGIAVGDYDQDLDLDYYVTNVARNYLFENLGDGTFSDSTSGVGVDDEFVDLIAQDSTATGWGTAFFDIDNDAYLDLFVVNGFMPVASISENAKIDPDKVYHNNGDGTFSDVSSAVGIGNADLGRGFAFGDIDNDGDNDALVIPVSSVDFGNTSTILYENELSNSNNWLKVSLEGVTSNRDGIGSLITIWTDGKSWVHEVSGGSSHLCQNALDAHFGVGTDTEVDSIWVEWPSGTLDTFHNVTVNTTLMVEEGETTNQVGVLTTENAMDRFRIFPNPATTTLFIRSTIAESGKATLKISNALGQVVQQHNLMVQEGESTLQLELNRKNITTGVYYCELTFNGASTTYKLMVE